MQPMPKKKVISRLLLSSFFLLPMIPWQAAMAGGSCSSGSCGFTSVAPPVQRPPATASARHSFTATGGSRVAQINLSQEGRDVLNAEGKEAPLPKGCLMAADRAKLMAKQPPLYGWPEDATPSSSSSSSRERSRYSIAKHVSRTSPGKVLRTSARPIKSGTGIKVAMTAKAREKRAMLT